MTEFFQHMVNMLILGSTYALLGIGLTLIFGIMRIVNFAHGELYAFGAYFVYFVAILLGFNFFLSLLIAIVAGCLLGALIEVVLLRPMRGADIDTTMLIMIGAMIVMQNTEQYVWGGVAKSIVTPFPETPLVIGPFSVAWLRLFVFFAALALIAAAYFLINRTKLGKAMRATFQDRDTAALMGVNIQAIYSATFAIGSGLAAAAGALLGPVYRGFAADGQPRFAQGVCDRHPRRPRQHRRRHHRRLHPGLRRGDGRRLHFLRLSRRDGLPAHHRRAAVQADRAVRASGADWMKRLLPWIALLALASVPLWLRDPYLLNVFITTGIFIIAAMSLNLLLGYTGQLSLGHVAFFGIGAYASALTALGFDVELLFGIRVVHEPWPVWIGFILAILVSGLCG